MVDKSDITAPSIHVQCDPHSTFNVEGKSTVTGPSPDGVHRLSVQDDVEPDSLSDASKSDDGSIIEQRSKAVTATKDDNHRLLAKSTSFYIESDESQSKTESGVLKSSSRRDEKNASKTFSTATLTKLKGNEDSGKIKPTASAPVLGDRTKNPEYKEAAVPLIRQESFTTERPSNPRLPNISSQPAEKDPEVELFQKSSSQDTHSYLKETEDVLAVLEAKIQAGQSGTSPSPVMDSPSAESDVDTSSTVSQRSNKVKPNILTKRPSVGGLRRERSSASITSQDSNPHSTFLERPRSQGADSTNKTDSVRRPVGLKRSVGKCGSTDLSDDPHGLLYSDQESNTYQTHKRYTVPLQKEDGRPSRVSQALNRANSLSAPRPTRASMLRRARLGEASDNEGTETDRLSQDVAGVSAKQPQEPKKLSRLDLLAMPRKRTSSFNTPSDTESYSAPLGAGKSTGFSNRSTESGGSSNRKASVAGPKTGERPQKAALNKTPVTRGRSSSAKYTSSTASE